MINFWMLAYRGTFDYNEVLVEPNDHVGRLFADVVASEIAAAYRDEPQAGARGAAIYALTRLGVPFSVDEVDQPVKGRVY